MKRLIDLSSNEDFAELSQILERLRHGDVVATLKQVMKKPDGSYAYADLQKMVVDKANPLLQMNGKWFYLTMQSINDQNTRKMHSMWNTVLQKGTQQAKAGKTNDYMMVIDVVRSDLEEGMARSFVYCITAIQPVICSPDGKGNLSFVFEIEDITCAKDPITAEELEFELSEETEEPFFGDDDDDDDNSQETDNYTGEAFVDNSKYTEV